ncbi:DUF6402 family protein [Vibrio europaeus]|uniref:DUF6402 family protein n=1 Tax=Vibrio europaeus TaxID=300876 RepID=UPI002341AF8D|nr:DUF6402 family protein [Vibrio europaeus]MDC5842174.1 DUF6402 family protein [Vibrio europaeus]
MDKKTFEAYTKGLGLNRKAPLTSASPVLKFLSLDSIETIASSDSLNSASKSIETRLEAQRLENTLANDKAFEDAQSSDRERVFTVIDIPDVMEYKLGWPKSAEVMRKWFSLPGRAMTDNEKVGIEPYITTHTDSTIFSWQWLESFERVNKVKETLLSDKVLWSENAKDELKNCLRKSNHDFTHSDIDNRSLTVMELHTNWQFQHSKVGYELGAVDDLYGSLGNFALYAAIQKAHFYEEDGQSYLRVTEVAIYMRDTFDFIGVQYLGHWDHGGMGINVIGGAFNMREWQWRLPAWNPKLGIIDAFGNQDFREYRQACGKGGDLLLFSDIVTVDIDEKIKIAS